MLRYALKRTLIIIPTMLLIIFIVYFILHLMPNTPGRIILGIQATQEQVDALNDSLGYNDPLPTQYARYIVSALHGDFGESYQYHRPVFDILLPKFPTTLKLAFFSMLVACLLGVPIGVTAAVKKYSAVDMITTVTGLFFASIPTFFLGILMLLLFSLRLEWLPSNGIGSFKSYIMPVLSLSLPSMAFISRMSRSTMLDVINQDYIQTAKAKGCSPMRIIFHHELRNAMMPVVTQVGMDFAALLGGSVIVENVFGLPGFGNVILNAIHAQDAPIIMASVVLLSGLFMLIMLAVDLSYALLDPRVAAKSFAGGKKA
ncbi:MAG: ABC transporter permease [Clostridiales bacterium]|nr:ABC transporter permease [Clostridiales bacterium]